MTNPINVFICYKKLLAGDRPNEKAGILQFILNEDDGLFKPWIDDSGLPAGIVWETEIYRKLLVSDVLLVLIGPGTSESQWVKREIALATALGIEIVPLGFDLTRAEMDKELTALDIHHLQGRLTQNIKLTTRQPLLSELRDDLKAATVRTKKNQIDTLRELLERRNPPTPKALDNQRAASFKINIGGKSLPLHIAAGDMARVREIDVLVNSENDYMQMARFFESRTVSSMLRRRGARVRAGRYEDTIQQELDWQLRDQGRPVRFAEVFATSSGDPGSELAKLNKARYIFHVAAVQAVDAEGIVIPFKQPHQIEACVRATLSKLAEINQFRGIISPPDTEQRRDQETRANQGGGIARSILFPLFGTGQGGSSASEIIGPMLAGISGYFNEQDNGQLINEISDIFISAYRKQDVEEVVRALKIALP